LSEGLRASRLGEVDEALAADAMMAVWHRFDLFPMETLTKAWLYRQPGGARQRTVEEMVEHRRAYGTSGNCFDLAIWLLHELRQAGVPAHAIGHDLFTAGAHVAVLAYQGGQRYLCDLGDMWIRPISIDLADASDPLPGYFPGANVQIDQRGSECVVTYHRPSGKASRQTYSLVEVGDEELVRAGWHSQGLVRRPLCEMRVALPGETAHWEFDNWASFLSTSSSLHKEPPAGSVDGWSERIAARTGISREVVAQALDVYQGLRRKGHAGVQDTLGLPTSPEGGESLGNTRPPR
jgi:hypothetical protein